ncbi:MAG: TIM44-like domain-containing protein [Deltaproteobacteria bacterium]|nr:TIM44-like domain-containing protein [Deltaproteobacteria bacterium]
MKWTFWLSVLLAIFIGPDPSWARGGGGCLEEGTRVLTPTGSTAIERLQPGDRVLGVSAGCLQAVEVQGVTVVQPEMILEILAGDETLRVTAEHPLMIARGEFRIASFLRIGDAVYLARDGTIFEARIHSIHSEPATRPAFNLMVSPAGTFVSSGFVVHNKGCFLPEGMVLKPDGTQLPISTVQPGEELLAFTPEGQPVRTRVQSVLRRTVDEYVILKTDRQMLRVTIDHPFYIGDGRFKTLEVLRAGDRIMAWDGRSLTGQRIVSMDTVRESTEVFNLQTDYPNTFFVDHLAVHNKGGGGGGGHSSSSSSHSSSGSGSSGSSGDSVIGFIVFFFFIAFFVVILIIIIRRPDKNQNLDFVYNRKAITPKAAKTEKLISFLSKQDPSVTPEDLKHLAETTFRKLQECWEKREFSPMATLLMNDLFKQQSAQLEGLVRNHEINRIEKLAIKQIDLVHVRYTEKHDQREFTALITAMAQDYYVDDRTGKFLRGDQSPATFQEFWTFHFSDRAWRLREIEQAGESDVLKNENFAEMLTDDTIKGIYAEAAGKDGAAGPWLEKSVGQKATRIDRMLNFLVQTDKIWNRNSMLERARQVFMDIYLSRESADPAKVPVADLFPEVSENLKNQLIQWQSEGLRVEYRNLCVRKVELILVQNFTDQSRDEFTTRISAHAQRILRKADAVWSGQEDVTPFEEYWAFGRLDGVWKLKEVLPPAGGKKKITKENVDEDSNRDQLQWYYRQPRAN